MDNKTTIEELKNDVEKFCTDRDWTKFHNPKDIAIGISTEANELLALFRLKTVDDVKKIMSIENRVDVVDELADVLYWVLIFAYNNNIDLSSALKEKLVKAGVKYPIDKCKGTNIKYTEFNK